MSEIKISVREHDIDICILRALYSSKKFADKLFSFCGYYGYKLDAAQNSQIEADRRESDVVIDLSSDDIRKKIRIENKIDAVFQPNQIHDYLERKKNDDCEGTVILLAPQKYLDKTSFKDVLILSYETLEDWMKEIGDLFSGILIQTAIKKQEENNDREVRNPDENVTEFYRQFKQYIEEKYPNVKISSRDKTRGSKSNWVYFKCEKGMKLVYKANQGKVTVVKKDAEPHSYDIEAPIIDFHTEFDIKQKIATDMLMPIIENELLSQRSLVDRWLEDEEGFCIV